MLLKLLKKYRTIRTDLQMYVQANLIKTFGYVISEEEVKSLIVSKYNLGNFKNHRVVSLSLSEKSESLGIEAIRDKVSTLYFSFDEMVFFFIFKSENLTIEAQNFLLKFIEEPVRNLSINLIDSSKSLKSPLLDTLVSRCEIIYITNQTLESRCISAEIKLTLQELEKMEVETLTSIYTYLLRKHSKEISNAKNLPFLVRYRNTELLKSFLIIDILKMQQYNAE
ncbi:hypothetical protein D6810_02075 [Candidatus Dojkabacteria bacterium]|uniref:Uncharacterized protein n=1 Tax=Candidatus Dojkabacteria bacterium TaxID=2099670 RepID=A0A3M0YY81_9BACT|nr:MAG: hypothetical protein D6810_02075 [Candidatus Dojkabacteria bacterium]